MDEDHKDENQTDKIVELNTEETEQVVGGATATPVGPAGRLGGQPPAKVDPMTGLPHRGISKE